MLQLNSLRHRAEIYYNYSDTYSTLLQKNKEALGEIAALKIKACYSLIEATDDLLLPSTVNMEILQHTS